MEKLIFILLFLTGCYTGDENKNPKKNHKPEKSQVQEVLNAPQNYLKTTVGQIEKAKEAKKLAEKTQEERIKLTENMGE